MFIFRLLYTRTTHNCYFENLITYHCHPVIDITTLLCNSDRTVKSSVCVKMNKKNTFLSNPQNDLNSPHEIEFGESWQHMRC